MRIKVRLPSPHLSFCCSLSWINNTRKMKVYLMLLLLLLPLCSAGQFNIHCYGNDNYMVNNLLQDCSGDVQQACYTRDNGEKGCTTLEHCKRDGWNCCYTNRCNA